MIKISRSVIQDNGSFVVSGDIAATGYYARSTGGTLQSVSGTITDLGKFAATLDNSVPPVLAYKYEPDAGADAGSLQEAAEAIVAALVQAFVVNPLPPTISGETPFEASTEVTIEAGSRADIHYTTNGDTPTAESAAYEGPITLEATATVKAIAVVDGVASGVASATFTKQEAQAPAAGEGGEGGEG